MVTPILPPRRETSLTERQQRFVLLLIEGKTRREAVREAGYEVADDKSADSRASELMRNPKVYAYYTDERAKMASLSTMDGVKWVEYLRLIAVEAIGAGDWAGAVAAMREIGKHLGMYELDHKQKQHTSAEVDQMKEKLVALGMDFTRKNFPAHLLTQSQQPKSGDS